MDAITRDLQNPVPWTLLYADDVMLASEDKDELEREVQAWCDRLERFGLKLNVKKTEYLTTDVTESSSIKVNGIELPRTSVFKYLGSAVTSDGKLMIEVNSIQRVSTACSKWRSLTGVLCDRKMPERLKSKIYRAVVRPVAMYGAECLTAIKEVEARLSDMETKMLRWTAGVTRLDRIRNDATRQKFGVAPIADKMREARLRWYGHVLRGEEDGVRKIGLNFEVIGKRPRGRPKQRWLDTLHADLKITGVYPDLALDRERLALKQLFPEITAITATKDKVFIYDGFDNIMWKYSTGNEDKRTVFAGDLSECYGLAADRVSGIVYYSSASPGYSAIYAVNDVVRRSIIDSSSNPELRQPKHLVFIEESASLLWHDVGYSPAGFFTSRGDGSKISRIMTESFDELLGDVSGVAYDRQGGRVLWLTSKQSLVMAMDAKTFAIAPFTFSNGSLIDAITVDPWTGDVLLVVEDVLCGLKSCQHLCLRSAKNSYECLCAQGYTMVGNTCRVSNETLLIVGDKILSTANNSAPVFIFHPVVAFKQWRDVAIDAKNDLIYLISDFELWVTHLNGSYAERLLNSEDTLTAIAVDTVTGNIILAAEIARRVGEIFVLDPKRTKENLRVRLVTDQEGPVRHLTVDPSKGLLFWSRDCIKKANYDGSNVTCLVNATTTQFAIDPTTSRLCFLEKSGEIRCVQYDGEKNEVVGFFSVIDTLQSEIVIGDENLYIIQRKKIPSNTLLVTRMKREASGNFTKTSAYNTTSTLRFRSAAVYRKKLDEATNPCEKSNGGCSHMCIFSDGSAQCLCAYSLLKPDGSCAVNPAFLAYSHSGIVDFVSLSTNTTVPRGSLRFPEIPRGITVVEADPDRNQLILVDRASNRIIVFRFTTNNWYSVADDVGEVEGISLDAPNRELYYTRLSPPSIWRLSLSADDPASYPVVPTRVAFLGQGNKPKDIAVHPCRMLIFFTNAGNEPSIERMFYSGYKRERIVEEEVIGETRLSIDFKAEKLYFAEITSAKIYRADFDGLNKEIVIPGHENRTTLLRRPYALAIVDDQLVYSNIGSYAPKLELVIADKIDGLGERLIVETPTPVQSITASTTNSQKCGADACLSLTCGDECRLDARGEPHCACRGERKLNADNVTCSGSEYATKACAENEFLCRVVDRCIPYEETCDRYPDCALAEDEDEDMCSKRTCRPGYFNCGSGLCIPLSKKCDRNNDCVNFADEVDCECDEEEFKCDSGICIPRNFTCDMKPDCNDASDEKNCPPRDCSNSTDFDIPGLVNCAGTTQCILPQWRCDGSNDCWDNSDERDCREIVLPLLPGARPCTTEEFTCGRTRSCLPRAWVCDGQKDCADGSDEVDCGRQPFSTCDFDFYFPIVDAKNPYCP
ncbi:unnamed protein product [Heligmosomoides polygyrus]|uniref:Reverse transcriptase domain-containing protein n=1 Tax=Heligmosomoides polygyrus TaxID=6339 RepID=A0A183GE66_HELPZ|nr:unnamed protein product [Heligmosomoides polygyrus]